MAKVMISIPDPLLEEVDRYVADAGKTRSGFLQQLAEAELEGRRRGRRARVRELLAGPGSQGGRSAADLRELRDRR